MCLFLEEMGCPLGERFSERSIFFTGCCALNAFFLTSPRTSFWVASLTPRRILSPAAHNKTVVAQLHPFDSMKV